MDVVNAAISLCVGSVLLSLLIQVLGITLAYVARRWYYGVKELAS